MFFRSFRRPTTSRRPARGLRCTDLERRDAPAVFTVTTTADVGAGSLRSAVINANFSAGVDTISFDASFNTAKTITLGSELKLTEGVVINGPGSDLLTVSGNGAVQIFSMDAGAGKSQTLTLSGLTLARAYSPAIDVAGGAVNLVDESLLAVDVRFTDNEAWNGAGVFADHADVGGFLTFRDCAFDGNTATAGGAVYAGGDRDVTLLNCTGTNNQATGQFSGWGGVVCLNGLGDLSVSGCTFTDNSAQTGGALRTVHAGNVLIVDSLFSGNSAGAYGGAIAIHSWSDPGEWVIRNTTVSGNSANSGGGIGFASFFGALDTLRIENSTVTGNAAADEGGGLHVYGDLALESTIVTGNTATVLADVYCEDAVALKHSVLGATAGVTLHDLGGNFLNKGVAEIKLGPLADHGGQRRAHALAGDSPLLNQGSNPAGLASDSRGGSFPRSANGGVDVGAYERNPTLIVTNADDAGPGSLRQAVADADANAGVHEIITFDPVFFATPRTLTLSEQILIHDSVDILGPGAAQLTITNPTQRALWVNFYAKAGDTDEFLISGLTFADCRGVHQGGAVVGSYGEFTVRDCVFRGNSTNEGGALNMLGMDVTVENCTFANNKATEEGGAIFARTRLTVSGSTFSGNTAATDGGAVFLGASDAVDAVFENVTFSANSAGGNGGAIGFALGGGTIAVRNSTLVLNGAKNGGGIGEGAGGVAGITLESSVLNNASGFTGPDVASTGLVTMKRSLVVSGNGFTKTDLGGNLAFGTMPQLAPLAANGGPTLTHAPLAGSPLINAGINSAGLKTDQRGLLRNFGPAVDIGAVEVHAPPRVSTFVVDANTVQRSMVRSVTVTFNRVVLLNGSSFDLVRLGPGNPSGSVALTVDTSASTPDQTVAKITWAGDATFSQFTSLIDGQYRLIMVAAQIKDGSGQMLDGNNDGSGGDSQVRSFHRLFGDADGDADVDAADFGAFRSSFGTANFVFDFDNDGDVDASDFGAFRQRFGTGV